MTFLAVSKETLEAAHVLEAEGETISTPGKCRHLAINPVKGPCCSREEDEVQEVSVSPWLITFLEL